MGIWDLINEVDIDIKDIALTKFSYRQSKYIPSRNSTDLSFERGEEKWGKEINTCVLYADIRNSVQLQKIHHTQTLGRIYTSFTKSVLKAAKYHKGHVRNIIGDRVMVIFPEEECFTRAVNCAVSINHISSNIINSRFKDVNFKCGIGIDYGQMRVIKVGIDKRDGEKPENRNLVWVGYPANYASRLTDVANKKIEEELVEVTYKPLNLGKLLRNLGQTNLPSTRPPTSLLDLLNKKEEPDYLNEKTITVKKSEFYNELSQHSSGSNGLSFSKGIVVSHKEVKVNHKIPSILVTEKVFKEYKKLNPMDNSVKNNWWELLQISIDDIQGSVYGANLVWKKSE